MDINEWVGEDNKDLKPLTVEEFDNLVKEFNDAKAKLEEIDAVWKEATKVKEDLEAKILNALKASNKSKYFLDDVGTVYQINKYVVRTPKTIEEKKKFFDYIRGEYGTDTLLSYLSVNHHTLQGFYNQEVEKHKDNPEHQIPGLEAPTHLEDIGFRRAAKKGSK